jgi:N-acetyl-alpha-D-muramate 1-phosphate uridylyltransferase
MQCVVLAGGLGTRMRPRTETVPKVLLPIAGKPFAVHQLEHLAKVGVSRLVYCIGFLGEQVREVLGDGSHWGVSIAYADEGQVLRGTGGAIRLAWEQGLLEEYFAVLYGDSYLPIDFRMPHAAFLESGMPALMTVYRNQERFDKSNAQFQDGKVWYDKTAATAGKHFEFIDYGLLFFRQQLFAEALSERWDLAQLLHSLSAQGKLAGYEVASRFYEMGSLDGFSDLERYLLEKR